MRDYDRHSGDSDLGLATGHLWSVAAQESLDTDKTLPGSLPPIFGQDKC